MNAILGSSVQAKIRSFPTTSVTFSSGLLVENVWMHFGASSMYSEMEVNGTPVLILRMMKFTLSQSMKRLALL
jgi:hypothetical protein